MRARIASESAVERRRCTRSPSAPGIGTRRGSAPVVIRSWSNCSVSPPASVTVAAPGSIASTRVPVRSSMSWSA
jgi:hypothetical protein